jgi:hypothetical protein
MLHPLLLLLLWDTLTPGTPMVLPELQVSPWLMQLLHLPLFKLKHIN